MLKCLRIKQLMTTNNLRRFAMDRPRVTNLEMIDDRQTVARAWDSKARRTILLKDHNQTYGLGTVYNHSRCEREGIRVPQLITFHRIRERIITEIEYVPGVDLLTDLSGPQGHQAPVKKVLDVLLNSVQRYQESRLSHMDIKPENVVWDHETRKITLIDFEGMTSHRPVGTKKLKLPTGSGPYMSPETSERNSVHRNSDLWSTGITVLSIALRVNPIQKELVAAEGVREYCLSNMKARGYPQDLTNRVASLLHVDPESRV